MALVLLILFCLVVSAFLSCVEMAYVSSNQLKMRDCADQGNPAAEKVVRLYQKPQEFLSCILIGNNIVNVMATASLTYVFREYFHCQSEWAAALVMLPVLLIFGEMVPKDFGRIRSEKLLLRYAPVLEFIVMMFRLPVRTILKSVEKMLGRFQSVLHKNIFVSQNEFRLLIEESTRSGVLNDHEKQLINTVLDFERIHLSSVMIPLEKAVMADIHSTVAQVKALGKKHQVRMALVYEEIPSIVVGMVYLFDLLFEDQEQKNLKDYLRAPIFLTGSTSIEKAFLTLQKKRQSFAVVIDEKSEAVGIVPIERLIEF